MAGNESVRVAESWRHLVRNFRKYARRSFVGGDSIRNWLSLAQHHDLPTRLLDWSYSPYVALHFSHGIGEPRVPDIPGPLRPVPR